MKNDDGLERIIGRVLLVGVATATACLVAGLALSFVPAMSHPADVLLSAGLVVLLATPIARVAASVVVYIAERAWLFVALTCTVLAELGAAVFAAFNAISKKRSVGADRRAQPERRHFERPLPHLVQRCRGSSAKGQRAAGPCGAGF